MEVLIDNFICYYGVTSFDRYTKIENIRVSCLKNMNSALKELSTILMLFLYQSSFPTSQLTFVDKKQFSASGPVQLP